MVKAAWREKSINVVQLRVVVAGLMIVPRLAKSHWRPASARLAVWRH